MINKLFVAIFSSSLLILSIYVLFDKDKKANADSSSDQIIPKQVKAENCPNIDFHYIILSDDLISQQSRQVYIFLDEKAYSADNLELLFTEISKQYPQPQRLAIIVYTNWEQLLRPSECHLLALPDTSQRGADWAKYHHANYSRNEKGEYFEYNPILNTERLEKVVMR